MSEPGRQTVKNQIVIKTEMRLLHLDITANLPIYCRAAVQVLDECSRTLLCFVTKPTK
jgi:hypothetical protein